MARRHGELAAAAPAARRARVEDAAGSAGGIPTAHLSYTWLGIGAQWCDQSIHPALCSTVERDAPPCTPPRSAARRLPAPVLHRRHRRRRHRPRHRSLLHLHLLLLASKATTSITAIIIRLATPPGIAAPPPGAPRAARFILPATLAACAPTFANVHGLHTTLHRRLRFHMRRQLRESAVPGEEGGVGLQVARYGLCPLLTLGANTQPTARRTRGAHPCPDRLAPCL